jgi:type I restriction enzyme S subunit
MSLPRYDSYKDSGVEWLGEVPSHWDSCLAKRYLTVKSGDMISAERETEFGYPLIGGNGIRAYTHLHNTEEDTLVIGRVGAQCGCIHHIMEKFWASEHAFRVVPKKEYYNRFIFYVLRSLDLNKFAIKTAQPLLNTEIVETQWITIPSREEQIAIAEFLDRETGKIDALVAEQERLIALLAEKRQAVISHAVTKGLNPTAPLKPSGIDWLGDIPAHWEVKSTKRLFQLVAEPAPNDNDYELLSIYTAIGVRPRRELEQKGNKATTKDGYWIVKKGDLIVNKLLAWMGAIGISNYDGVTSPAYDILRPLGTVDPRYYDFLFRCGVCFTEFRRYSRGIMDMRLRLYFDELGQIKMPCPPATEQMEIVHLIEKTIEKFDVLTVEAQQAINILQERRTALISAAVTGKIDVRGQARKEQAA